LEQTWTAWLQKWRYNPSCDADEKSNSDMLNEELNIDSYNEMNLQIEPEAASEESSNEMSESENETGDKNPKAYTFTKNAGPQLNLLPDSEPMDYFTLFFNDEHMINIIIETDRCARHKIAELQLSPRSTWSMWSDVSDPKSRCF
jgi:hypothetical protein